MNSSKGVLPLRFQAKILQWLVAYKQYSTVRWWAGGLPNSIVLYCGVLVAYQTVWYCTVVCWWPTKQYSTVLWCAGGPANSMVLYWGVLVAHQTV